MTKMTTTINATETPATIIICGMSSCVCVEDVVVVSSVVSVSVVSVISVDVVDVITLVRILVGITIQP